MRQVFTAALAATAFVAGLTLAAPVAEADGVDLAVNDYIVLSDGVGNGNGGEFNAVQTDLDGNAVSPSQTWSGFCLETDEYFSPGSVMRINAISGTAYQGGSNTNSGDEISEQTAYLFTQFWNMTQEGDANGFLGVESDGVTARTTDYDATEHANNAYWLQRAIWYFEDEGAGYQFGSNGTTNNYYVQLALDNATGFGLGSVRVLNLVSLSGAHQQDQLVLLQDPPPVTIIPEPASLVLLGVGLAGIACVRRRRRSILVE